MNEKSRKVRYTMEGVGIFGFQKPNLFDYEDNEDERKEVFKEREGVFHGIGKTIQFKDDVAYEISCAIVEDCGDHKLRNIPIENIQFVN